MKKNVDNNRPLLVSTDPVLEGETSVGFALENDENDDRNRKLMIMLKLWWRQAENSKSKGL